MINPNAGSVCDCALDDLTGEQRIISLKESGEDLERTTRNDIKAAFQ